MRYGKPPALSERVLDKRRKLRLTIAASSKRRQALGIGHVGGCEGVAYVGHEGHACDGPLELNEVLIPRSLFQRMPQADQAYFFAEVNCSLVCQWFHARHGHTMAYRDWWERVAKRIYGAEAVWKFIAESPLKLKRRAK